MTRIPEQLYRGELVSFPSAWAFQLPSSGITLVSDEELEALGDPDRQINMSHGHEVRMASLREVCERAQAAGHRTLRLAFDHFFSQYRPGQAGPRRLMPDSDDYIRRIAAISRFAEQHGLGLELSLLSPLEIGKAYTGATGESGLWMHYRKGLRDPQTGEYSVQLWRHGRWVNNKGPISIEDAGIRVFAFRERRISGTPYRVVDPAGIVELRQSPQVQVFAGSRVGGGPTSLQLDRVRIFGSGTGEGDADGLDRVLVVQQYRTPEMDYFSDQALPFLKHLIDRYADAGVKLNGLYSDEMHIQQDWSYGDHHDHGQFALRYVSPGLARAFSTRYGEQYADFARYLIYFCQGQDDFANSVSAPRDDVAHVWGDTPEAIAETALLRSRYYRLLHTGVVELFMAAKHHAEKRMGHQLASRYHATWAESPTIDFWRSGPITRHSPQTYNASRYDYTPTFQWSNTVQQAASACDDYFRWGDFLIGTGNDTAECGYLDRNYVGLALACSTGSINAVPYSYAAHWGMPDPIRRRRMALVNAFGAGAEAPFALVEGMQHRDVDVLMLYPLDLVAASDRFGSWTAQYGYANQITAAKLLELGNVTGGRLEVAGRSYSTLVATFEPFPSEKLLSMMEKLVRGGGKVIWSGPPPLVTAEGTKALPRWQKLFGVRYEPSPMLGQLAAGYEVRFEEILGSVPPQIILTDLLVDHIYPVDAGKDVEVVARTKGAVIGACRRVGHGRAIYLGFRVRDDQSCHLGYDVRTWFEVLLALGAYAGTGRFKRINDNTENLSRTTDYAFCRFPNGAVAVAPHLRCVEETWPGGFARDAKVDGPLMKRFPPPSDAIQLDRVQVNGHLVSYSGTGAMAFRVDSRGRLLAFAGEQCKQVTVDGRKFMLADKPLKQFAFGPVDPARRTDAAVLAQVRVEGTGTVRIPADGLPKNLQLVLEGPTSGSRGPIIPSHRRGAALVFNAVPEVQAKWLYVLTAE